MSSNLVIVAIPADDDRVWKISSEKKPHMTLLFLGDSANVSNLEQIMLFVEHATTQSEHGPFYMDVDRRGVLGPDEADVLFFSQRSWNTKWIQQFRGQLLKNDAVKTAYDSTEQYPEWTPHLTLGYPTAPANPIPNDGFEHPIYSVLFDRIAVWTGDFEGPEFRLEWTDRDLKDAFVMSVLNDERKAVGLDELAHHGVKGMKWGQRKTTPNVVERPKNHMSKAQTTALVTLGPAAFVSKKLRANVAKNQIEGQAFQKDKAWEKDFQKAKTFRFDDQKFTNEYNAKWKGHDFSKEDWSSPSPSYKKYTDGYFKEMNTAYAKQFAEHYGSSPTGKYEAHHVPGTDLVKLRKTDVAQHSLEDGVLTTFRIQIDANGLITGLAQMEDSMAQTAELGAEFLEHFGVKGMKWGVRKEQAVSGARTAGVAAVRGAKATGRTLGRISSALGEHFYEQSVYSEYKHEAVHNRVADEIDSKIYRLQNAPKYRGKNLKADKALETEYHQDVAKVTDAAYRRAVKDVYGENSKGTKEARYVDDARGARIEIRDKRTGEIRTQSDITSVQEINANRLDGVLNGSTSGAGSGTSQYGRGARHAASGGADVAEPDITIPLKLDANGQIKAVGRVKTKVEHAADLGAEWLAHYGVKGMKWGQRKEEFTTRIHQTRLQAEADRRSKRPAQDVKVYDTIGVAKRKKASIDTRGGFDHPPTQDAIKVATSQQKLKKSGVHALSNQELREVATRLQLEQQVSQLTGNKKSFTGKKFVDQHLTNNPKNQAKVFNFGLKKAKLARRLATAAQAGQ